MKQQNTLTVALAIAPGSFLFGYNITIMLGTTPKLRSQLSMNGILLEFISALGIPGTIPDGKFAKLDLDYSRLRSMKINK